MEFARKDMVQRGLHPLAVATGRSPAELTQEGLSATNFPLAGVRIEYEDGSLVAFRYAFAVQDPTRPGRVAVFTEHCGYHEFALTADDVLVPAPPEA